MKEYVFVSDKWYFIKNNKAYEVTWDYETGLMSVATEKTTIVIPTVKYSYGEMYKKANVQYYVDYYAGTQLQTGVTATPKKTSQTISPSKGYDGLASVTVEATPLEEAEATPTTESQEIVATGTGKIGLSKVTVAAVTSAIDENIVAGNIKSGVTILGVAGSYVKPDDANLLPENIKSGVTIYGVEGTYTGE